MMPTRPAIYGVVAEFRDPTLLLAAARRAREEGFTHMDAYSPFPIEELPEALGIRKSWLPLLVLIGGIVGCVGGYLLQYIPAVHDYPINVGGRPLNSSPAFIPVT